jgi:OPA family glycerol-3-phosphate transporter-like MFS transporter
MIKIISCWYDYRSHSRIIGFLSLSFLFGDAFARAYLSLFLVLGFKWNIIMIISGFTLFFAVIPSLIFVKSSPKSINEEEPISNPENIFGDDSLNTQSKSFFEIILPILKSLK